MQCDDARRYVSERLDGELACRWRQPLEAHLAGCGVCARFADQCWALDRLIGDWPIDVPDAAHWWSLTGRVATAAGVTPVPERAKGPTLRVVAVLVAAALGLLLAGTFAARASAALQ